MGVIKIQYFFIISALVMLSSVLAIKDLEECGKDLSKKCGENIANSIFKNEEACDDCCKELITAGSACHKKLVQVTAPQYPQVNRKKAVAKGVEIWDHCMVVDFRSLI